MATSRCGQLRHVVRVCLLIWCELKRLLRWSSWSCLFCDRGVEMMHTHACLQEEEDCSIEEAIANKDNLRETVSVIVANSIIGNMIQCRLIQVRNSRFKLPLNVTFAPYLEKCCLTFTPYASSLCLFFTLRTGFYKTISRETWCRAGFIKLVSKCFGAHVNAPNRFRVTMWKNPQKPLYREH